MKKTDLMKEGWTVPEELGSPERWMIAGARMLSPQTDLTVRYRVKTVEPGCRTVEGKFLDRGLLWENPGSDKKTMVPAVRVTFESGEEVIAEVPAALFSDEQTWIEEVTVIANPKGDREFQISMVDGSYAVDPDPDFYRGRDKDRYILDQRAYASYIVDCARGEHQAGRQRLIGSFANRYVLPEAGWANDTIIQIVNGMVTVECKEPT